MKFRLEMSFERFTEVHSWQLMDQIIGVVSFCSHMPWLAKNGSLYCTDRLGVFTQVKFVKLE